LDKQRDTVWIPGIDVTVFSRTRPLPYEGALAANSFRPDGYIELIWNYDEGADSYQIQRHNDTTGIDTLVYSGTGVTFLDQTVNSDQNNLYTYTLLKIRNGQSYFGGKTTAVAVKTQVDAHEPNNTEGDATLLEDYRQGNLYYFRLSTGEEIIDVDWYKVSVPAGKTVNVAITYTNPANSDYFLQYNPYQEQPMITHNVPFHVRNDGNVQKIMYFAIIPNRTKFLNMMSSGGQLISYTITWMSISNNPQL
jgi:hypothetical protein